MKRFQFSTCYNTTEARGDIRKKSRNERKKLLANRSLQCYEIRDTDSERGSSGDTVEAATKREKTIHAICREVAI